MNDLRSPLEDRPYRANTTRSDERVIATSEYYRTKFGRIRQSRWFPLGSVLAAVIVFSAIVSYAYKQGSQSGENATTPIIVADSSATVEKPENPGGMEVPFQDAVVFDQLQKDTEGKETVENLLAPPEQPAAATTATTTAETTTAPAAATTETPVAAETTTTTTTPTVTETPAAPVTTSTTTTTAATTTTPAPATAPEVKKMTEVAPASAPATTKITGGDYRIQMGAFRDEAAARAAWGKFQKEFSSQLTSVTPAFPRADLGAKGTFYRVQGINLSKASADELCRSLNAARAGSCMVVR
jgi:cell division septation protein DedD